MGTHNLSMIGDMPIAQPNTLGKGCLVDRTIPIHTRTRGVSVPPQEMGMYYRVVRPYGYKPVCMLLNKLAPP